MLASTHERHLFRFVGLRALTLAAILLVSGCTTLPPPEVLSGIDHIKWETSPGPFCGRCDSTEIIIAYDGRVWIEQGHWAGDYKDWRSSRRQVQVASEQVARFRERLDPYRPEDERRLGDAPPCKSYVTDSAEIMIKWHDDKGDARLAYELGCAMEGTIRQDLETAPNLLGMAGLDFREWR